MDRWAIVGASGFVGSHLVDALEGMGIQVTRIAAPRLSVSPESGVCQIRDYVDADSIEFRALSVKLAGHHVVVNAAGDARPNAKASFNQSGANAALPLFIGLAADRAKVPMYIHYSSAAVQGRLQPLDGGERYQPFSPYSRSKALGEQALVAVFATERPSRTRVCVIRATSVQGPGRATTSKLERFARSPLASVAGLGFDPSPVSSIQTLIEFTTRTALGPGPVVSVAIQPWDGLTTADVIRNYGQREPLHLPRWFCHSVVCLLLAGTTVGWARFGAFGRRLEVLWFGQRIQSGTNDG